MMQSGPHRPVRRGRFPNPLPLTPLSLGLGLALGACSVQPPPVPAPDVAIPETWTAAADPAIATTEPGETRSASNTLLEPWWQSFDDPRLDRLIREALDRNHDLAALVAAVDRAEAQARITGADLKPQVSGRLDGSRREQVFVGLPIPGQSGPLKSRSTSTSTQVDVRWEADLWGRLRSGRNAALGDVVAAEADLAAARLALSGRVARAWYSLVEAESQHALALDTATSRGQTTRRVEARYRQGLVPSVDVRLARANEARAVASRERAEAVRDAARRQLEVLVGRYPEGALASVAQLPDMPPPVPAGLPAEIVARRPDLQASEARVTAAGYRMAEARAAFYPSLTLTGSVGTSSDSLEDLLDGDFSVWSLAGGLLQPIFQGGRLRAAADLAAAGREAVLANHAQALLGAFAEVEIALGADGWLAAEETALTTAVTEARAASVLAEDRYRAGVGDYLAVLDSQRQAFGNESAALTVRRQRLTNRVDLHLALGGTLPDPSPTSETPSNPAPTHDTDRHSDAVEALSP